MTDRRGTRFCAVHAQYKGNDIFVAVYTRTRYPKQKGLQFMNQIIHKEVENERIGLIDRRILAREDEGD